MPNLSEKINPFRKHFFPLCFIIISITLVYSNSMKGEFILDDAKIKYRTNLHVTELNFESLKNTVYFTPSLERIHRPLPSLSLALNYYFGKEDPSGYHVVNITIHILCSIAVYIFLHLLLSIPGIRPSYAAKFSHEIAVIGTFLFALHPIQTNVATYITQRMTSMAALFYIISVSGYFVFRINTLPDTGNKFIRKYTGLVVSLFSGICALFSKENTAMLPVMILVTDYLLFFHIGSRRQKEKLVRIYIITIVVLLALFTVFGLKPLLLNVGGYGQFENIHRDFTPIERLLTESRVVFFYLYLLFVPSLNLLNLNHDFEISKNIFFPPQTFFAIIGVVILLAGAFLIKKRNNLISFAILWYFVNLVIESTILPLEIIYEHRTYIPSVMIFMIFSLCIVYTSKKILKNDKFILVTSLLIIVLANGTYLRNFYFSNNISMWTDVVAKSPNLARAHVNLGKAFYDYGYQMEAMREYEKAIDLNPDMTEALVNLSTLYIVSQKKLDVALDLAKRAMVSNPRSVLGPEKLAYVYMRLKDYKKAEHLYSLAVKRQYYFLPAINGLGLAKMRLGKTDEAAKVFQYGIKIEPSFDVFHANLAKIHIDDQKFTEAILLLEEYLLKYKNTKRVLVLLEHAKNKLKAADRAER